MKVISEIHFKANFKDFQINLNSPLEASSYDELRQKARNEVELFMLNHSIPGPYILYYL